MAYSPRTARPAPRPRNRPVPVPALHQGQLARQGQPTRAKARHPDAENEKKWDVGRATELAARLGMTHAYDGAITENERGWTAYDSRTDPHTQRRWQRQKALQRTGDAASIKPRPTSAPRVNPVNSRQQPVARPATRQRADGEPAQSSAREMGKATGTVAYWDGGTFVRRMRCESPATLAAASGTGSRRGSKYAELLASRHVLSGGDPAGPFR